MSVESKPRVETPSHASATGTERLTSWLAEAGLSLPAYMGPRSESGRLSVQIIGSGDERTTALTIATLLASSFQDFRVTLPSASLDGSTALASWLESDARFRAQDPAPGNWSRFEAVLVLPAGVLLTKYSLEALFETLRQPGTSVVRAVVPGQPQALEFWDGRFLAAAGGRSAEAAARNTNAERWIDGAALGLHQAGDPAPKVFFRRGAADRHIIDVNVMTAPPKNPLGHRVTARRMVKALARRIKAVPASAKGRTASG